MESLSTRKPCFLEDDNGLASIADHAFFSSPENHHNHRRRHHRLTRPLCSPRKTTNPKNYASFQQVSSPRSPYFLDACFLCKKPLGGNTDIFMYRGDTAFCSDECRTKQIDKDEEKEKNWNVSVSIKSMTEKSSPNKTSKNYPFQSGAVAAA